MQHQPIERLTFKDGKIYELYNGKLSNPFMSFSELQVTKKLFVKERDQTSCEFGFELNSPADPVWISMFKEHAGELAVEFQGDRMLLTCVSAHLQDCYSRVKDSMAHTNSRYGKEREELIAKVVAKDEALKVLRQKQEDRAAALKDQFDRLQI
jgi:hypothetical protein